MKHSVATGKMERVTWARSPAWPLEFYEGGEGARRQSSMEYLSQATVFTDITQHMKKVLGKQISFRYLATKRNFFFPSSCNNLAFLKICRSATLQAPMAASRGFRFSVGGWIELDTDQFCVC
jgi:hypothetical protein